MTLEEARQRAVLSIPEFCQLTGTCERVAYRLAQEGAIPARRLGRRWVVPTPLLLNWLGVQEGEPR